MTVTTGEQFLAALLYNSRTDSSIDWAQFEGLGRKVPPIDDRQRCELLLRAVNGDALSIKDWSRFVGAPLQLLLTTRGAKVRIAGIQLLDEARPTLKAALERVIEDPLTADREIDKNATEILNGNLLILPQIEEVGGERIKREQVIATSLGPALVYALTVFLDPQLPYGALLRRCGFDECRKFALGVPRKTRGQPPVFYCKQSRHRELNELRQARERTAAHRAGVTVEVWRKRQAKGEVRK